METRSGNGPRLISFLHWTLFLSIVAHISALSQPVHAVSFGYFVRFHGIRYIGDQFQEGRPVTTDDLGPEFGRVTCNIVDLYWSASGSMGPTPESEAKMGQCEQQEGGASSLSVATPVYRMRDYRSDYRLAAFTGYQWMIFHASENNRAGVGEDLFDLEAKVDSITFRIDDFLSPRNAPTVRLQAKRDIEKVVSTINGAPVVSRTVLFQAYHGSYQYWITFWFRDGTAHGVGYSPVTGLLGPGLQLPATFRLFVERHLPPPRVDVPSPAQNHQ